MQARVLALVPLLLLAGCAGVRPRPAPALPVVATSARPPAASLPFITTFWCGPPLALFDDARAAEIAAAGFTVVGPPCERDRHPELTQAALDIAARHGLTLWVADWRYDEQARQRPGWESSLDAAVADYRGHPGFGGYFLADEPVAGQFEDLGAIAARLRTQDPGHIAYVNLLADYAAGGAGAASYRDYVERFITAVRPAVLSYDYYPFGTSGDRGTFFTSLALMRELADQHHLPFMLIVLAMPHGPYRDPTEAELRWQVFHALAYGARGISYFAYWTPVDVEHADVMKFRHGLIEGGTPTRHYAEASRINRVARAMAAELDGYRSVAVADSAGEVAAPPPIGPIEAIEAIDGGRVTAGLFADDDGRLAVLLVNRDYRQATGVRLRLRAGVMLPERFDPETRMWAEGSDGPVRLVPGGAELVRWAR